MTRDARERGLIKLPAISLARLTSGWSGPLRRPLCSEFTRSLLRRRSVSPEDSGTAALSLLALVEVQHRCGHLCIHGLVGNLSSVNLSSGASIVATQTSLEFPVPHRVFGRVSGTLVALIVVSLVYCVFAWPAAPLGRRQAGTSINGPEILPKAPTLLSEVGSLYFAVWSAAALLGVVALRSAVPRKMEIPTPGRS